MGTAHAEVFEALLRQAPRSQARSWEASTTPSDVARLMVRSCLDDVGDVIDPAVGLGSALLEAHAPRSCALLIAPLFTSRLPDQCSIMVLMTTCLQTACSDESWSGGRGRCSPRLPQIPA